MKKLSVMRRKEIIAGFMFILPWLLGFLAFTLGPLIASFIISLHKWDLLNAPRFIGLQNYRVMLRDPNFWNSLRVTAIYSFCRLPLTLTLSLSIAILLNQKIKCLGLFRTVYYLPTVLPLVASSMVWMWIFNPQYGILNYLIWKYFKVQGPAWLGDERFILPAFILMSLWWIGSNMLVYLGGLQGIPTELYEAAEIDGAGMFARFRHITLPMISPVLFYNIITTLINSFETFTQVYVMAGDIPRRNAQFYIMNLYNNAFRFYKMGYASALAWAFFLVLMVFTLLIFKSSSAWVYYEGTVKGGEKNG